jgi:multisubunit Na+/H+ antiporter MnhB subunit
LLPLVLAFPFLKGLWIHLDLPLLGELHLGTPMLFDLGVFLTVMGITIEIIFSLLGEE